MVEKKEVPIKIPTEMAEKIEKRMEGTAFISVSDYVNYILQQVLSNLEEPETKKSSDSAEQEEKKVQERLKRLESLGYMD